MYHDSDLNINIFFFFSSRRRHTRYWRDWSSDVCSSDLTAGVQERLWITDPYFLSMPILTQSLMATARDGVDVRVLLPSTNDLPVVGMLSRTGYRRFLGGGGGAYAEWGDH